MSRSAFKEHIAANLQNLPNPTNALPLPSLAPGVAPGVLAPNIIPSGMGYPNPTQGTQVSPLPDFQPANLITPDRVTLPGVLIDGILHRGCKMVLAGGSKSYKSWSLIDLGLAISTGGQWWGMACRPGKVLYINFELIDGFFHQRLLTTCQARGINPPENFLHWGLRGKCYDLSTLSVVLKARAAYVGQIDLIVIDPVYKALGDLDENSAGDMGQLMRSVEELSDATGAAVVFGAHFSKGSQSGKESMDRISGSGVFARDPDAILTLTRHREQGSYTVESELRYLPHLPPFVVSWEFPRMRLDEGKDPRDLWEPGIQSRKEQTDQTPIFTEIDVLSLLPHSGLQDPAWRALVIQQFGKAGNYFYECKKKLLESGKVIKKGLVYCNTNLTLTNSY